MRNLVDKIVQSKSSCVEISKNILLLRQLRGPEDAKAAALKGGEEEQPAMDPDGTTQANPATPRQSSGPGADDEHFAVLGRGGHEN